MTDQPTPQSEAHPEIRAWFDRLPDRAPSPLTCGETRAMLAQAHTEALDVDALREDALIPLLLSCAYDMSHITAEDIRVLSYRLAHSPVRLAAKADR